jgi:DNA-binding transcriptional LysR family regulator
MFDERVLADLDVLDHLQLYGSTVKVADLLGLSQSSCSRRYRYLSELLDLDFDRGDNGYAARQNVDVLTAMRQAAQKLRVRRSLLRCSSGWQAPALVFPQSFRSLKIPSMSTSQMLSLLDGRLVDVWFGGLLECQPLIPAALPVLQANRLALGQNLLAVPLLRWNYVLVSHRNHPLQKCSVITPDDLAAYPSPALAMGVAPLFTRALQEHGLATCAYRGADYEPVRWEGGAADGHSLAVVPPHRLPELEAQLGLVPLPYSLGIQEVMAVVGHRDVIADPCFVKAFQALRDVLRQAPLGRCSKVSWLH